MECRYLRMINDTEKKKTRGPTQRISRIERKTNEKEVFRTINEKRTFTDAIRAKRAGRASS